MPSEPTPLSATLRERTQEINAEYWAVRQSQSERVAVAQMAFALACAERDAARAAAPDPVLDVERWAFALHEAMPEHMGPHDKARMPLDGMEPNCYAIARRLIAALSTPAAPSDEEVIRIAHDIVYADETGQDEERTRAVAELRAALPVVVEIPDAATHSDP